MHKSFVTCIAILVATGVVEAQEVGPLLIPPLEVNVLSAEPPLKEKWSHSGPVLFFQAITNFPSEHNVSWLIGMAMGNDGAFLHTRVGVVFEETVIQKWEADPESGDAISSPLNGYYDSGRFIKIATNQVVVCLIKTPQRGSAGVDVYLLRTNSASLVFESRSHAGSDTDFFFADTNGDGRKEIIRKDSEAGNETITIWDWSERERVFVKRKNNETATTWDRLLKSNPSAIIF